MNTFEKSMLSKLNDIIDEIIAETEDSYTDEILCELQQDPDKRQEAFEYLLDMALEEYEISNT